MAALEQSLNKEQELDVEDVCAICLDPLSSAECTKLPCSHNFHSSCIAELREFGVTQACPLCRASLPQGAQSILEEAVLKYLQFN
jgi:hypothetical protein